MFDHVGPVDQRGLASGFCLRNLGMERFVCSAKIHIHEYLFRDSAHVEVGSFDSLHYSGSKGKIICWKTQKKNHGMEGFRKIESSFHKLLEVDMIFVDTQVGIGRINAELESLVEQTELSRESNCHKESFEDVPKSLRN